MAISHWHHSSSWDQVPDRKSQRNRSGHYDVSSADLRTTTKQNRLKTETRLRTRRRRQLEVTAPARMIGSTLIPSEDASGRKRTSKNYSPLPPLIFRTTALMHLAVACNCQPKVFAEKSWTDLRESSRRPLDCPANSSRCRKL